MRKLVVVAMVVMTVLLAGCTTSTAKTHGRRDRTDPGVRCLCFSGEGIALLGT